MTYFYSQYPGYAYQHYHQQEFHPYHDRVEEEAPHHHQFDYRSDMIHSMEPLPDIEMIEHDDMLFKALDIKEEDDQFHNSMPSLKEEEDEQEYDQDENMDNDDENRVPPPPPTTTGPLSPVSSSERKTPAKSQKSTSSRASPSVTTDDEPRDLVTVDMPSKFDVLCGQSRICANHTGNRRFQVVLDIYAPTYQQVTTKQEKMALTKEIVASIGAAGGRFLKYKDGSWTEIPSVTARDKVSHALRTKVASWNRQKKESVASASPVKSSPASAKKPQRSRSSVCSTASFSSTISTPTSSPARSAMARKQHRKRRSSTSIMTSSFDGTHDPTNSVMGDLLKAQREIFNNLRDSASSDMDVHPLKR